MRPCRHAAPCPFCGSTSNEWHTPSEHVVAVSCGHDACQATGPRISIGWDAPDRDAAERMAVAGWNEAWHGRDWIDLDAAD